MLLLCDETIILPIQIIFSNILTTSIYPDMWKLADVTPIFKKGDKQLIKNYRPILLLPICGKIIEKLFTIIFFFFFKDFSSRTKIAHGLAAKFSQHHGKS